MSEARVWTEDARIEALRAVVPDLPDLAAEVDDLVTRASQLSGAPMASLNLLDTDLQHQPSTAGFVGSPSPRADAMCNTVLVQRQAVYTPDARTDPRFATNPWVDGRTSTVRFYASFPLRTDAGHIIGTLCVFDTEVHELDEAQRAALQRLADEMMQRLQAAARHRSA